MMLTEPTDLLKTPLANFSDTVKQFGIQAKDMFKDVTALTRTNLDAEVDLIGFNYSAEPDSLLVSDKIYTSSYPESIQELHNCNNCGGTIDELGYCKYCGSRVYFFGNRKE